MKWVENNTDNVKGVFEIVFYASGILAFLTHLGWSIGTLYSNEVVKTNDVILMIFGTMFPPAGAIHGYIIWFAC